MTAFGPVADLILSPKRVRESGIGRTAIYELINTGQLPARKRGRHTLILAEDLRRCLESLPAIKVKSQKNF